MIDDRLGYDIHYPPIDLIATGENIRLLRIAHGQSVDDLQHYLGLASPQTIYKWQRGVTLPTVDHLYALSQKWNVPMETILVRQ
jgi:transcriptional regulator with XRE-family HTH domain